MDEGVANPNGYAAEFKPFPVNVLPARDQGERSRVDGRHEPQEPGQRPGANPLGDGRDGKGVGDLAAGDAPVKVADILERFTRETRLRFREGSGTPTTYSEVFRRFARMADLENVSRQALAGKRGRILILDFMAQVPPRSRRTVLAALKCVWTTGTGLPFPVDARRDFGKSLPPTGRRRTPPDDLVRPWAEAVAREKDPYIKAFVLCVLQYGWRPENQLAHLRWRYVRYDGGHMDHIDADGVEARFKWPSPIAAAVTEDIRRALEAWRAVSPASGEDDWIFPLRGIKKPVQRGLPQRKEALRDLWNAFARKHDLPKLRPCDARHFVKTALRRLGLSDPALAAWQGHDAKSLATEAGAPMRGQYDTPQLEAILDEQRTLATRGPLGLLVLPDIHDEPALPPEAVRIVADLLAGTISDLDAAAALGKLRTKLAKNPTLLEA